MGPGRGPPVYAIVFVLQSQLKLSLDAVFAIRRLLFAIGRLLFAIGRLLFAIGRLLFARQTDSDGYTDTQVRI